jgi:hypothetical protein
MSLRRLLLGDRASINSLSSKLGVLCVFVVKISSVLPLRLCVRVWLGALIVSGEIVGAWRRSAKAISIDTWRRLSPVEWEAVEAEAGTLPLPGLNGRIEIQRS